MSDLARQANYDEAKVPDYELPSALTSPDGKVISTAYDWTNRQRGYVLGLFENEMYGPVPARPESMRFEILSGKADALGGKASRKEIRIHLQNRGHQHYIDMLLYVPNNVDSPPPVFLSLNFFGNHAQSSESDIRITDRWVRPNDEIGVVDNKSTEKTRGSCSRRWPLTQIIERGYAAATIYYGDMYPDNPNGFADSIYQLYANDSSCREDFGSSISAWAYGLSRGLDCLESLPEVCAKKTIVLGHSRLGKTALWAGATDSRFAGVISNDSGQGGSAISRRRFGETIETFAGHKIDYWFLPKHLEYAHRENELPFDQHMLISLMAPRPVYIASASLDLWADPYGEFLAAVNAAPVYRLFGSNGLGSEKMPENDSPIHGDIGYHIRTGKHDVLLEDWNFFMNFFDGKVEK